MYKYRIILAIMIIAPIVFITSSIMFILYGINIAFLLLLGSLAVTVLSPALIPCLQSQKDEYYYQKTYEYADFIRQNYYYYNLKEHLCLPVHVAQHPTKTAAPHDVYIQISNIFTPPRVEINYISFKAFVDYTDKHKGNYKHIMLKTELEEKYPELLV